MASLREITEITENGTMVTLVAAGFNMNSYATTLQPILYIPFQMVTHPVCFFHTNILRHY